MQHHSRELPKNAAMATSENTRFLLVVTHGHRTFPLSNIVIGDGHPAWTSANRRVGVWTWPESRGVPAEGRLQFQIGGHGPRKGHFVAIDINSLGQGSITQDDFGLAPLYVATRGGFSFAANRPELIASAWHRMTGGQPERDLVFGALLALKGIPMGDRTGYAGICCVPFLAFLSVTPAGIRTVHRSEPPWLPGEGTRVKSEPAMQAAVDEVEAILTADMRHAVSGQPTRVGRPALQLTGGRDSRLAVALALRSGVIDDVDVVTHGDKRTPDARIARQVAQAANARHSLYRWSSTERDLFTHVRNTSGALNLWEASEPVPPFQRTMIISGLLGETLRSNFPSTAPPSTRSHVLRAFFGAPSLDLLTEDAWFDAMVEAMQLLMSPASRGARPEDLHDAFYVQHRIRRWVSVRPGAFHRTFFPLYCPRAVCLAFAAGWQARAENAIHDAIIARTGSDLTAIPYADAKQVRRPRPSSIAYPEDGVPVLDRGALLEIARRWRHKRPRWRAERTRTTPSPQTARRVALYLETIGARGDSPAFDVIDKDRLVAAIRHLPGMKLHLAKQVHGAMATVIWLGGLETSTPRLGRHSWKPEVRHHVGDR